MSLKRPWCFKWWRGLLRKGFLIYISFFGDQCAQWLVNPKVPWLADLPVLWLVRFLCFCVVINLAWGISIPLSLLMLFWLILMWIASLTWREHQWYSLSRKLTLYQSEKWSILMACFKTADNFNDVESIKALQGIIYTTPSCLSWGARDVSRYCMFL